MSRTRCPKRTIHVLEQRTHGCALVTGAISEPHVGQFKVKTPRCTVRLLDGVIGPHPPSRCIGGVPRDSVFMRFYAGAVTSEARPERADPLAEDAAEVPSVQPTDVTLVDGRSFAISDASGDIRAGVQGFVYDDVRHLSELVLTVSGHRTELLIGAAPTPLSGVFVSRLQDESSGAATTLLVTRKRWLVDGLRDEIHVQNLGGAPAEAEVSLAVGADFAHLFDVKAGRSSETIADLVRGEDGWLLADARTDASATRIRCRPPPDEHDLSIRTLRWVLHLAPRTTARVCVTAEAVQDEVPRPIPIPCGVEVAESIPVRASAMWKEAAPKVVSSDARLVQAVDQALADLAALRIVDAAHPDRVFVAAGAPWFMTLFGRDSLLTAWMMLPFDASLARGVLLALAELQGTHVDADADEEPGKILHELRRRGGAARSRPVRVLRLDRRHAAVRRVGSGGLALGRARARRPLGLRSSRGSPRSIGSKASSARTASSPTSGKARPDSQTRAGRTPGTVSRSPTAGSPTHRSRSSKYRVTRTPPFSARCSSQARCGSDTNPIASSTR